MSRLSAQGDIILERLYDAPMSGRLIGAVKDRVIVVAQGEATGHSHRIFGSATLYRDDALAREIPRGLYVGHVRIDSASARLDHEEHASLVLLKGTYRVRRQWQLEPMDIGMNDDFNTLED